MSGRPTGERSLKNAECWSRNCGGRDELDQRDIVGVVSLAVGRMCCALPSRRYIWPLRRAHHADAFALGKWLHRRVPAGGRVQAKGWGEKIQVARVPRLAPFMDCTQGPCSYAPGRSASLLPCSLLCYPGLIILNLVRVGGSEAEIESRVHTTQSRHTHPLPSLEDCS